jgi:hypothetical protein
MTTITIKNDAELKFSKTSFQNSRELLEFLIKSFENETILAEIDKNDLSAKDLESFEMHKKDGYDNFINFQG